MDELKKIEEKIRLATDEKNKYVTIIESLPNPVILADENNRFEYMNQAAARLFENSQTCGARFDSPADDRLEDFQDDSTVGSVESCLPWLQNELADFAKAAQLTRNFDKTMLSEAGNRIYAIRFHRLQDLSTKLWGTVIFLEDITEKKKAADALRLSEARFRSIFESTTDCILVWDQDCNYLYANQAAIEHVGTTRAKVIGKNIRDGLGHLPQFMQLWMERVEKVFDTGQPMRVEDAIQVGSKFVYSESVLSPIKDAQGKMFAVGVLYRDVTERKELENKLKQQNVALENSNQELERANRQIIEQQKAVIEEERLKVLLQMAGATAHELNQPLMALLGYVDLMAMDRDNPAKVEKYSQKIEAAGRRIADIVKKIQTIRHHEVKYSPREAAILNLDQPISILSIEDNELDFKKIQAAIGHSSQIHFEHAEDIDAALEQIERKSFDLIFVDYALPSGNAIDFMTMMEEKQLDIPMVVITGKGDEMIASQVIQYGAYDYLPKSRISKKSLARIILNTLEKFKMKSEIKQVMGKMAELSTKDELTGLYNRRYFMEFAEREVSGAARYGQNLSLLMMDIDYFKQINDKHGHPAGDAVLKQTAGILKEITRKYDVACRFGGEEFAVIMPNTPLADAQIYGERLRKKIENTTVYYDETEIGFTVSIGLAQFSPESDKSVTRLIKQADDGLYTAKQQGRNRVVTVDHTAMLAAN